MKFYLHCCHCFGINAILVLVFLMCVNPIIVLFWGCLYRVPYCDCLLFQPEKLFLVHFCVFHLQSDSGLVLTVNFGCIKYIIEGDMELSRDMSSREWHDEVHIACMCRQRSVYICIIVAN